MAPESEHNEVHHHEKADEHKQLVDQPAAEVAPDFAQDLTLNHPPTIPRDMSSALSHSDRGSRERLANGLQQQLGNAYFQRIVQRKSQGLASSSTIEDEQELATRIQAASSGGQSLDTNIQKQLESDLKSDLSSVHVHTGVEADHLARSVDSVAFTTGQDIFFSSGAYDPSSLQGLHLLAHETAHTAQQSAGPAPGTLAQGGLYISNPFDSFEQQAEQKADQLVSGHDSGTQKAYPTASAGDSGMVVKRAPAPGTMAQQMEKEANAEQAQVAASPPPRVAEMSTINDAEQARSQITQIERAQGNLFQAHAAFENEKKEAGSAYSEVGEADKKINQSQSFIDKDEEVKGTLQGIVDLSVGASTPISTEGGNPDIDATVGANMRLSTFSSLFVNLERDFARLQGVVSAFLTQHPNVRNAAGSTAGSNLGTAVATGGKTNRSPADVNNDVQNAERKDNLLLDLVGQFKIKLDAYTGANHAQLIENQVHNSGMKTNELRTLAADLSLPVQRADTPDEASAKVDIAKINTDLAEAKKGLDRIQKVFKLAVEVAGMPALGGAAAAVEAPSTASQIKSGAEKGADVVKTLTDIDIEDEIKNELAKVMTDYTSRMNSANGKLEASQYLKTNLAKRIDMEKVNAAKTEMQTAFDMLHQAVAKAEQQKKEIHDAAAKITKYQAAHGGGKTGSDIASITTSLGEVTIFIEQAKVTKEQGVKEKVLADEMVKRREKLAGGYNAASPDQPGGQDLLGNQRIAVAEKEKVYYDCEKIGDRFYYKMNPIRFELWTDKIRQTPDASRNEVETLLKEIDEYLGTAEGFKAPLQEAMFGS